MSDDGDRAARGPERVWLVSACLLGETCRYDGAAAGDLARGRALRLHGARVVPVCPEVEGGLPVPRAAVHLEGGDGHDVLEGRARVRAVDGVDRTEALVEGARAAVRAARGSGATHACLKARSPSCGRGAVHGPQGLFAGDGVAAAALLREGLVVVTDEELPDLLDGPGPGGASIDPRAAKPVEHEPE